jgi:hypothetical protein
MLMPKKKVISMLEFLRTGTVLGVSVDSNIADVFKVFGKPDYIWQSLTPNVSCTGFGDLEFWFFNDSKQLNQIKFRIWDNNNKPIKICRAKLNPWVICFGLRLEVAKRFLKSAKLEFEQTKPSNYINQISLASGVTLLFDDPKHIYSEGLGWLGIQVEGSNV